MTSCLLQILMSRVRDVTQQDSSNSDRDGTLAGISVSAATTANVEADF